MFISLCSDIEKVVLDSVDKGLYVVNTEVWSMKFDPENPVTIEAAYNPQGQYIGDVRAAKIYCDKYGIAPVVAKPDHTVCSIGFSEKDGKWYGWSHRAIYGFQIGDTVKEGDCAYTPERGEWTAETDEDVRQMAMDFAESVSSDQFMSSSADLKVQHFMYNFDRPVKMRSGERVLTLSKGKLFKLTTFKGYPCVIRDGVVYIIKEDSVRELKKRSSLLKPEKGQVKLTGLFDVLGHDFEPYALACAKTLAKETDISHGFDNGVAYAKFTARSQTGEVVCVLQVTTTSVTAAIYKPATLDLKGWDFFPKFQRAAQKLAKMIVDQKNLPVGKFQTGRAVVANVGMPWGGVFSGTILSYYAKLEISDKRS